MRKILSITITLLFVLLAQQNEENIEVNLGLKGIAGKFGMLYLVDDYGLTPGFGIWADFGTIGQYVSLDGGVEYWNAGRPERDAVVRKSDLAIFFTAKVNFDIEKLKPFLGGGLGFNMYSKIYPDEWAQPDEKNSALEPHIEMGTIYALHPKLHLEGRIKINFSDVTSYGLYVSGIFKMH